MDWAASYESRGLVGPDNKIFRKIKKIDEMNNFGQYCHILVFLVSLE